MVHSSYNPRAQSYKTEHSIYFDKWELLVPRKAMVGGIADISNPDRFYHLQHDL